MKKQNYSTFTSYLSKKHKNVDCTTTFFKLMQKLYL